MGLGSFFSERVELAQFLEGAAEYSLLNVYQTDLPKVMIVAAASNFEVTVTNHIEEFFGSTSSHSTAAQFVKNKALFRSYHQLFSWNGTNATTFTNFFGQECTALLKEQITAHDWLEQSIRDFVELGRARNELVHGDYANYSPSLTVSEVQIKYESASRFVDVIPRIIRLEAVA